MHFEGAQSQTPKCMISLRFKRGFGGVFAPLLNGMPRPPEMGRVRIFFVGPAGQERVRIFFRGARPAGDVLGFFSRRRLGGNVSGFFSRRRLGRDVLGFFFAAGAGQRTC